MGEPRGIFVTGTDTGVGKSIVAATLVTLLRRRGLRVGVMKPVTTGCRRENGELVSDDAHLLAWAAGGGVDETVAPFRYAPAVAPSVAAEANGETIRFDLIAGAYRSVARSCDFVVVEGAGGLMVPVSGGLLMADLASALRLPLLVVARPSLGTVNHTLLTCFAARQLGLEVRGVVISGYPDTPDEAQASAPHLIDSLSGAPLLGRFPLVAAEGDRERVERLADLLAGRPETAILLKEVTRD